MVGTAGRRIAFVAPDLTGTDSLWTRGLEAQSAQMIDGTSGANFPFWSPDGQMVMINQEFVASESDLMIVSLTGDHTPSPYLQTPFNEHSGRFSPDEKSVAHVSNESGRNEVYVQSFPRNGSQDPDFRDRRDTPRVERR